MSTHVSWDDFIQKANKKFDISSGGDDSLISLGIGVNDFIEFIESEFELTERQQGMVKSEVKEDTQLLDIYGVIF
jgi:hypothetical protein